MNAKALFQAGRLSEAIEAQIQDVKAHPSDQARRIFLFELLAYSGDLDRAARQIDAVIYEDAELEIAVMMYRRLLESERARRALFTVGKIPEFLGEPPEHLKLRLDATLRLREGHLPEAAELLDRANEATAGLKGTLNDRPFELLRDVDDLFAGVLEAMAHGTYYWIGLDQVERLEIEPPKFPRDLLYIPASVLVGGKMGPVFLPALYPNSHEHPDDAIRLGRGTDWKTAEVGPTLGVGQHLYLCDDDDIGILEVRSLQMSPAEGGE